MLQLYKCIYRTAGATDKREGDAQKERGRLLLTREHLKKKKNT